MSGRGTIPYEARPNNVLDPPSHPGDNLRLGFRAEERHPDHSSQEFHVSEQINRIGDYEILNELGAGGMGRVYKVRNTISDRIETMKILLPDLAGRQELAARFLREIKLLASLNHPNIAQLRTAFANDNQLVMIMEYVEGVSMATHLSGSSISVADALNYIDQVLNALSYAHQQNVIHRDIKPGNMMLTPQGVVKVM